MTFTVKKLHKGKKNYLQDKHYIFVFNCFHFLNDTVIIWMDAINIWTKITDAIPGILKVTDQVIEDTLCQTWTNS